MRTAFEFPWLFADQVTANHLISWIASILLHFVWQGAVIGAVCWLFLQSASSTAARLRYVVACVAMLLMAMSPVISGIVFRDQLHAISPTSAPLQSPQVQPLVSLGERPSTTLDASPADVSRQPRQQSSNAWQLSSAFFIVQRWYDWVVNRLGRVLVAGWLLGVTFCSFRLWSSLQAVRALRQSAVPIVNEQLSATFSRLIDRLRSNPSIRLMQSAKVVVPTVLGWIRPIILLPVAFSSGLTLEQIEAVLAHELAHIQRHDYLVNLIQSVVETLLFYHPAVWWISSVIRNEREHCCDAIAVKSIADPSHYAKALFELARLVTRPNELSMSAAGGSLKGRVARILNVPKSDQSGSATAVVAAMGVVVIIALAISQLSSASASDESLKSKPRPKVPVRIPRVTFVMTPHLLLHDNRIITWDDVDPIIEAAIAKYDKVQPAFLQTHASLRMPEKHQEDMNRWQRESYARFYKEKKLVGYQMGSVSPRASQRYDRIKSAADLIPDDATKLMGRIVDADKRPIKDVEVILLPRSFSGGISVHLQNGQLRDPHDEHLVRTGDTGQFSTFQENGEVFIVAIHPEGFYFGEISSLDADHVIMLQPWARIDGSVALEENIKQSVNFTGYPRGDISFNIWETEIDKDGQFDQPFLPPGKIIAQRGLQAGNAGLLFTVSQWILEPDQSEEFTLGPIPEEQKEQAQKMARKNEQR